MMPEVSKCHRLIKTVVLVAIFSSFREERIPASAAGSLISVQFVNTVGGSRIVFNDSTYTNGFGEKYTLSKLRYYITNISVSGADGNFRESNSYHLIDEGKPESQLLNFTMPAGDYTAINFLVGVDSLHNVSGAQTDALDPANDMFWTWHSGYVMAKMEGNSPESKQVNNKFEYHIGGYSGPDNVLRLVSLAFPGGSLHIIAGKNYTLTISADINTWWQSRHSIKISENPVITTPGIMARYMSQNYAGMFHIDKISSQ
jgi:hypothetical protein